MPNLSDAKVKGAEPPAKGRRLIFDEHRDAPRGFGLRVTARGARSFVLRYQAEGRDRVLTIGAYPTWTLAAARRQAGEYRRRIDSGEDILQKRRDERAESTVADAVARFLRTKQGLRSYKDIEATLNNHLLPRIGEAKIASVRKHQIIEAVEDVSANHGRTAALLLTYCKQLWSWAEDRGLVQVDVAAGIKPGKVSANMRPRSRDRVLSEAEIKALWTRTAAPEGMSADTLRALHLILATGQRPGEVASMRFDEIKGRTWTIPAAKRKVDAAHSVPLTDSALSIIEQARHQARKGQAYVFEPKPGRPLTAEAIAKAVFRSAGSLGMEGRWTPHDLRRTMRTGLAAERIPEHVAELTIGHTKKGLQATYDLHRYDAEKGEALGAWERRLLRIAHGQPDEDETVVRLKGAAR